jgi:hypothetical protein
MTKSYSFVTKSRTVDVKKSAEADFSGGGAGSAYAWTQAKFWFTKPQLTTFHHASTNFGRALR